MLVVKVALVVIFVSLNQVVAQQTQQVLLPEYIQPGGTISFNQQGEGDLYGNEVALRHAYLSSSANRAWLNIDHPLPAGFIQRFYIYVHNVSTLDPQSRRIRLQVWRLVDVNLKKFRLIWRQRIEVSAGHTNGALYSYKLPEPVPTMEHDYIGFTNEGKVGPISFSYSPLQRTLFTDRYENADAMPGDEFAFSSPLQAAFSIAVQLSTELYGKGLAGFTGDTVVMQCRINGSASMHWTVTSGTTIANTARGVLPGYPRLSLNDSTEEQFDLLVNSAQLDDAGTYTCYAGWKEVVNAELTLLNVQFFSNVTESDLLEGDNVLLNCHIHARGNFKPNITVEIKDSQGGRLTFEKHSPLNNFTEVQYNVIFTPSMSGPFYCTVTAAAVTMETVSKTVNVTLNRVLDNTSLPSVSSTIVPVLHSLSVLLLAILY